MINGVRPWHAELRQRYGVRLRVTIGDRVTTLYSDVGAKTISQKDQSIAPISLLIYKKSGCQIIQFPVNKGNLGPLRATSDMQRVLFLSAMPGWLNR